MRRTLLLLPLFAAIAAPVVHAQAGGNGPVPALLEPLDWGPNAAWRQKATLVRATRALLLRSGNLTALNAVRGAPFFSQSMIAQAALGTAVTGAFRVPVVPIAYKDVAVPYPLTNYQCLLFSHTPGACGLSGDRPYSVASFYEELSHHRIAMDGVVFPAVRQDSVAAFYTDGCKGITVGNSTTCPARPLNRMAVMLLATLDSISNRPGFDTVWSQFDNDGPDGIPNSGDDNGVVDFVTFLQPEVGGECTSNVPAVTGVWSHRFRISGWTGSRYTTRTPRRGPGGVPIAGQFIKVDDYTIQSELGGSTSCDGAQIMGVGTVAHETGHAFGLPDLYDTRGSTQGIGGWGLMGSGNYARPYSPSSYDAWSLNVLGWTTMDTLGASRIVSAGPRLLSDTIYYAKTKDGDEYVLLENRASVLSDTAQMNPNLPATCPILGFCAKSPGLLLWLIAESKVQAGLADNTVNFGTPQGVSLIQADGLNQLRALGSRNRGDRGDAFPGSSNNTRISLLTGPAARDNLGGYFGFIVDQIQELGTGAMRFRFTRREPSLILAQNGAQVRVDAQLWDRFEEVVSAGDQLQVSVDAEQILSAGKTRARFLAWSNRGPRDQTLVSSAAKPDTLIASFALEHRLLLPTPAGGVVVSSVPGQLSTGVFLSEGATATLSATPSSGFVFAGWRGDTVAISTTLNLTMRKGYDLEAKFVAAVSVVSADAVSDLLGTPKLTDTQRSFLDELGNRNGILDVGDLLAMFRRSGQVAPAALRIPAASALTRKRTKDPQ